MAKIMMDRRSENNREVQYLGNVPEVTVLGLPVPRTIRLMTNYPNIEGWIRLS